MSHDLVAIEVSARPDAFEVSPGSTAVIVVDMQHDFAAPQGMFGRAGIPLAGIRAVIEPTLRFIEAARRAGLLVVYLTMEFDQDLANMGSATAPNRLRHLLMGAGQEVSAPTTRVASLIFTGCTTSVCVESTLRDAFYRDYRCLLLTDCCAEAVGSTETRTNHEATITVVEALFDWTTESTSFVSVLQVNAA